MLFTLSEIYYDKPLQKILLKSLPNISFLQGPHFFTGLLSLLAPPKKKLKIFQLVQTGRSGPLPILPSPFHVFERRTIGGKGGKVA